MMGERYLTLDEMRSVEGPYPMMVFADNARGWFSFAVKAKTKGYYGHFMWLIAPDALASQWLWFKLFCLDHFAGCHLKFVCGRHWTIAERSNILNAIRRDLSLPWWKTLYDVPGVLFRLFGLRINVPWLDFCSERGAYLRLADGEYDLESPTPSELNGWTKARPDRYEVFARYSPD